MLPDTDDKGFQVVPLVSQCTYRCVVLPDEEAHASWLISTQGLNAPTGAWCSLTLLRSSFPGGSSRLNAPTGVWCSLTIKDDAREQRRLVSMHLQVRGAP